MVAYLILSSVLKPFRTLDAFNIYSLICLAVLYNTCLAAINISITKVLNNSKDAGSNNIEVNY